MRFPLSLTANLTGYLAGKTIRGEKKFPLVMMLEPLHACNLTCTGCGRIREYRPTRIRALPRGPRPRLAPRRSDPWPQVARANPLARRAIESARDAAAPLLADVQTLPVYEKP